MPVLSPFVPVFKVFARPEAVPDFAQMVGMVNCLGTSQRSCNGYKRNWNGRKCD